MQPFLHWSVFWRPWCSEDLSEFVRLLTPQNVEDSPDRHKIPTSYYSNASFSILMKNLPLYKSCDIEPCQETLLSLHIMASIFLKAPKCVAQSKSCVHIPSHRVANGVNIHTSILPSGLILCCATWICLHLQVQENICRSRSGEKVSNLPYISQIRSLRTADDFHCLINLLEIILSQHIPGYRPHTGEA